MALGVARLDEGVSLRTAGITLPILVLGYLPPEGAAEAVGCDLTLTVFDYESAQAYAAAARANGRIARLHVKVETGMGRLGIHPENTPDLVRALHQLPGAEVEGIYTHLARADCADSSSARAQIARFEEVLAVLSQLGLRPKLRHAANSAGALFLPASRYDFIRAGIAVYGLPPSDELPCPVNLVPVLSWKAIVTQVKTLPAGHGISYGSEYVTREPETVAVLGAGYGDGFRRLPTGRMHPADVLLGGQRAPVRGRVMRL
jgi:alanine racemase